MNVAKNPSLPPIRILHSNMFVNLLGTLIPAIFGLMAIPIMLAGMGVERFGVMLIIWMLIGYLKIFDLGIGRSLTQAVSSMNGAGDKKGQPRLIWTAISILCGMGIVGGLLVSFGASYIIHNFKIDLALQHEATRAFLYLGLGVPFVLLCSAFRGVLEAYQNFKYVNYVRIPLGVLTYLIPMVIISFSSDLKYMAISLVLLRLIAAVVYFLLVVKIIPEVIDVKAPSVLEGRNLARMGGWLTLSNLVTPGMVQLDRVLIGILISGAAVAYYGAPYELVTKFLILPGVISVVLFPAFASANKASSGKEAKLLAYGLWGNFIGNFVLLIVFFPIVETVIYWWLGSEVSVNSGAIARLLLVGVFLSGLSQIPFSYLQGIGRADLTAKFHVVELPIYVFLLWYGLSVYGVIGAALAYILRVILDLSLLTVFTAKLANDSRELMISSFYATVLGLCMFALVECLRVNAGIGVALTASIVMAAFVIKCLWYRATGQALPVISMPRSKS